MSLSKRGVDPAQRGRRYWAKGDVLKLAQVYMEGQGMDLKVMLTTFGMIFLAELGDKTQLATFAFAAESKTRLAVFLGSAGALVLTSLLAVVFGSAVSRLIPANYIKVGAGVLFLLLGLWMLLSPGGK